MTAVAVRSHGSSAVRGTRFSASRRKWILALLLVAALAFVFRLVILVQVGGLDGVDGYDDGVYYGAADALVHGRLPYRDFLLLQPPGAIVALAPFAWLGSVTTDPVGVVVARLCFIGIGALNATLAMRVARRFGVIAAAIGGIGYAVYFPAAYTERSTLLEPLGTCGLLVAVLLVERTDRYPRYGLLLAGLAAGVAITMRIWYVVPVLLIAAVHWRRAMRFLVGAVISATAVCLPFFAADPAAMMREVVLDQLGRSRGTSPSLFGRLATYLGSTNLRLPQPWSAILSVHTLGVLLILVVCACGVAAVTLPGARLYPLAAAAAAAVLLASPSFFLHYAALAAPWVVLTVAVGATRMLSVVRNIHVRVVVASLLIVAAAALGLRTMQLSRPSAPIPVSALGPAAHRIAGCVQSDDPQILAALDVLSTDLQRGCVVWPDVTGYTYDRDSLRLAGVDVPRNQNHRWQADVARFLLSGQATIIHRTATGLDVANRRRIDAGPTLAHAGSWALHAVSTGR